MSHIENETKTTLEMVREFHDACGIPTLESPDISDDERMSLRFDLIAEEFQETRNAWIDGNIKEFLDGLCDLQYVLDGTFLESGFASLKQAAIEEVHRSNMSKLDDDGKAIYRKDGKVLKGPNYSPPNLEPFVNGEFIKEQLSSLSTITSHEFEPHRDESDGGGPECQYCHAPEMSHTTDPADAILAVKGGE